MAVAVISDRSAGEYPLQGLGQYHASGCRVHARPPAGTGDMIGIADEWSNPGHRPRFSLRRGRAHADPDRFFRTAHQIPLHTDDFAGHHRAAARSSCWPTRCREVRSPTGATDSCRPATASQHGRADGDTNRARFVVGCDGPATEHQRGQTRPGLVASPACDVRRARPRLHPRRHHGIARPMIESSVFYLATNGLTSWRRSRSAFTESRAERVSAPSSRVRVRPGHMRHRNLARTQTSSPS